MGDLGEICVLCVQDWPIELLGFIDPAAQTGQFAGLPVVDRVEAFGDLNAVILTDLQSPQETYDRLRTAQPGLPVLVPRLLRVSPNPILEE